MTQRDVEENPLLQNHRGGALTKDGAYKLNQLIHNLIPPKVGEKARTMALTFILDPETGHIIEPHKKKTLHVDYIIQKD